MYIKPQKVIPSLMRSLQDMPLSEVEFEFRDLKRNRPKPGSVEMDEWHLKFSSQ